MGCLTVILNIFNVIFWLIGGSMLGLGIWLLVDDDISEYFMVVGDEWYWEVAFYSITGAGALILAVGVLGTLGTCTENKVILILYGVFATIAILAEIAAIIFVAIFYANKNLIGGNMYNAVKNDYESEDSTDALSNAWDRMQIQWQCCGSSSYKDYYESHFQEVNGVFVPWTCCTLKNYPPGPYPNKEDVLDYDKCQRAAAPNSFVAEPYRYLYQDGCYSEVQDVMDIAAPVTLSVLSLFVVLQIFGVGMSCALRSQKVSNGKLI